MKISPRRGDVIAVWFSNGAASAVALKETIRKYGKICEIRALNNPVLEEDPDNLRFCADVSRWLGIEIQHIKHSQWPNASAEEVWAKTRAMSFNTGATCTNRLKIQARQEYESKHKIDWHVFGFTADEVARHERFILTERQNVIPVLIDEGITKDDCYRMVRECGVRLPDVYSRGYPNANCIGCVKASGITYWNHVRMDRPDVFERRARQSRELGVKLVRYKGERIYLDQLPPDATGRPMKSMSVECGIICEEYTNPPDSKSIWERFIERLIWDDAE